MTNIVPFWPFDQAPNVASVTTRQVIDENMPILIVTHYEEDHSWGFFCGTNFLTEDGRLIGMGTALKLDPSLASIANLPPGWTACRDAIGAAWHRTKD